MMPALSEVRAVTFDFFNTLVYHRAGRGRGSMLMLYLEEQGLESDPWEHQALYDVFEPHGVEYSPSLPLEERQEYYRRLAGRVFRRLNVRAPRESAGDHATRLWSLLGPDSLAIYRDVHEALRRLEEARYPLAVVSNWQCGLAHFCAELGLAGYLDHVLASAEVGSRKPEQGIFADACRRLGVPPPHILHVGDGVIDDVQGASDAGLQVVLLRREPNAGARNGHGDAVDSPGSRSHTGEVEAPTISSLEHLPALLGMG